MLDAEKWLAQSGTSEESCMAGDVNLFLTDLGDPPTLISARIAEAYTDLPKNGILIFAKGVKNLA